MYQPLVYVSPLTIIPTLDAYVPTLGIRLTLIPTLDDYVTTLAACPIVRPVKSPLFTLILVIALSIFWLFSF